MMTSENDKINYLAIDYGRRRVGIAGCRGDVRIAFGITTLVIDGLSDLFTQLQPILEERSVTNIVLGFPITLGDKPGTLKNELLSLAEKLRGRGYAVHLVDEAMSSEKAGSKLRQRGKRSQKEDLDRVAAALFLQEYLDGEIPELSLEEIEKLSVNH